MTSSQHFGPAQVGVNRMRTPRHDPGRMVAGNGLLTILNVAQHWSERLSFLSSCLSSQSQSSQSRQPALIGSGLNATFVTWRSQSPLLQIEMVRSARWPRSTGPKWPLPVTTRCPLGAVPVRASVRGPAGSSLVTVNVADFAPKLVGSKRICTSAEAPAAMTMGYTTTWGTRNSAEDEV